ncbi:Transcription elongation factor GreA [Labeo rohita]|uniref:Transcription elongation factor GreA n=1 Tax=Labeo rohita TaxID=84645 RepID=A0ABQ8LXE5_LABRO|nr:Transcription elongation factor GreA [Labeo rohita]
MSRRLRSILPITVARLQPKVTPQHVLRNRRGACQYRQQLYYNRSVKALPLLAARTHMRMPAEITQPANTHRSYHIQTDEDRCSGSIGDTSAKRARAQVHQRTTNLHHLTALPQTCKLNLLNSHLANHNKNILAIPQDSAVQSSLDKYLTYNHKTD